MNGDKLCICVNQGSKDQESCSATSYLFVHLICLFRIPHWPSYLSSDV